MSVITSRTLGSRTPPPPQNKRNLYKRPKKRKEKKLPPLNTLRNSILTDGSFDLLIYHY